MLPTEGSAAHPARFTTEPLRQAILDCARQWTLDPILLEAQILVESSGNPYAFRYEAAFYHQYLRGKPEWIVWGPLAACSYGLLQIVGAVAVELGFSGAPTELFHVPTNLFWAGKKLAALKEAVLDHHPEGMLAAYNGGLGGNRQPPYRNQDYVQRVLDQKAFLDVNRGPSPA